MTNALDKYVELRTKVRHRSNASAMLVEDPIYRGEIALSPERIHDYPHYSTRDFDAIFASKKTREVLTELQPQMMQKRGEFVSLDEAGQSRHL